MKRIYVVSTVLIAASSSAGVGLSALHGMALVEEPRLVKFASLEPTHSGFLIPEFVPTQPIAPTVAAPLVVTPVEVALAPASMPIGESPETRFDTTPIVNFGLPALAIVDDELTEGDFIRDEVFTPDFEVKEPQEEAEEPLEYVRSTPANLSSVVRLPTTVIPTPSVVSRSAPEQLTAQSNLQPTYFVGVYR